MDISTSIINSHIVVIGENSSYPRKNDCHKVTIITDNNTFGNDYFPKTELKLIRAIQDIKQKLTVDELQTLIESINNHIEYEKDVTECDIAMSNDENS